MSYYFVNQEYNCILILIFILTFLIYVQEIWMPRMIRREKEKTRTGVDDMEDIDEHVEKVEPLTMFDKDSLIDINLEDDP